MVGCRRDRFVDESAVESLDTCGHCHHISANLVYTSCHHCFCKDCLNSFLENTTGDKWCPQCHRLLTDNITYDDLSDEFTDICISDNVFLKQNISLNKTVEDLLIRCPNDWNGCPDVFAMKYEDIHLKICLFKRCHKCNEPTTKGRPSGGDRHDCLDVLKTTVSELRQKYQNVNKKCQTSKGLTTLCDEYRVRLSRVSVTDYNNNVVNHNSDDSLPTNSVPDYGNETDSDVTEPIACTSIAHSVTHRVPIGNSCTQLATEYVMIGTFKTDGIDIELKDNGIKLLDVPRNEDLNTKHDIWMPFKHMQQMDICIEDPLIQVLIIYPNQELNDDIQRSLQLGFKSRNDCRLDVRSEDRREWFILIILSNQILEALAIELRNKCKKDTQCKSQIIKLAVAERVIRHAKGPPAERKMAAKRDYNGYLWLQESSPKKPRSGVTKRRRSSAATTSLNYTSGLDYIRD